MTWGSLGFGSYDVDFSGHPTAMARGSEFDEHNLMFKS